MLGDKLAALNAVLNGSSALLLVLGYISIKRRQKSAHKAFMVAAFVVSGIFLLSYLTRFYLTGVHRYPGTGFAKQLYLTILFTHTVLATAVPFLAIRSIYLAMKGRFAQHVRISRFTFPIWLYVSVTGVLVYFMLYH